MQRNVLDLEPLEDRSTPATLTVTNLSDTGAGSLRQAILDAENEVANPGSDTIVFAGAAVGGTVSLLDVASTDFGLSAQVISTAITIQGTGETITRGSGAPNERLFYVTSTGNLTLSNLTLRNGYARGGDGGTNLGDDGGGGGGGLGAGGAIYNRGTLFIVNSTLTDNVAQGGIGGAGADNAGTDAGGGGGGGGMGTSGGGGNVTDNANSDGGGGGGGFNGTGGNALAGGGGGGGGGLFQGGGDGGAVGGPGVQGGGNGGSTGVDGTAGGFGGGGGGAGNEATGGAGGLGGGGGGGGENDDATPNGGGAGGYGGGGGGGGENGFGGAGGFGAGGGGGSNGGSTARAGGAGGFGAGAGGSTVATGGSGGGGGGAGLGGAIFNDAGTVTITNSTFSDNLAVGGLPGAAGGTAAAGGVGNSAGGGVFNRNGTVTIRSSTITNNGSVLGRGVFNLGDAAASTVVLQNTILGKSDVTNTDYDGATLSGGTVVSSGSGNLIRVNSGFTGGIVSTADPLLGALQNNGGPTFTRLPGAGSPAINAGNNAAAAAISIDQRGFTPRNFGGTVDIGSVEVGASKLPPATLIGANQFGVGTDVGDGSVKFFNPDSTLRFTLTPFPGQPGGVRTAAGDFTGDGIADLVVGTGPGSATHVKVLDGVTQAVLFSVDPFEAAFKGGVYVAAGDITGDGIADLAITPDEGGGPRVRVFTGSGFTQIADFFGIDDKNFRGGARAAIGDLNADGKGDLIVVAGFGGGPRVAAFDGKQLQSNGGPKLFNDFFAFEQTLRNGIFVAAGDVNGDGFADLVAGGGPGGGPRVFILDGKSLVQNGSGTLVPVGNFFAGNVNSRGGIRVAVKNLDNDILADVVTGAGTGAGSRVAAYRGTNITPTGGTPPAFLDFDAFAGFGGGVFVG